jgi:hypothetical protein
MAMPSASTTTGTQKWASLQMARRTEGFMVFTDFFPHRNAAL